MATWKLKTPVGTIECHKSRSFGQFVWKKPAPDKIFKTAFFSEDGVPLDSDVYAHVKGKWIPAKGNDQYAKKVFYKDWEAMGKPKTIDGKKIGIVVKRMDSKGKAISNEMSMVWDATKEMKISKIHLHRFVSRDMKYILPEQNSIDMYVKANKYMNQKGVIFIAKNIRISNNTGVTYNYAIIPLEKHLAYVELLDEDLAKPFPTDALIPNENTDSISEFEDEGRDLI